MEIFQKELGTMKDFIAKLSLKNDAQSPLLSYLCFEGAN